MHCKRAVHPPPLKAMTLFPPCTHCPRPSHCSKPESCSESGCLGQITLAGAQADARLSSTERPLCWHNKPQSQANICRIKGWRGGEDRPRGRKARVEQEGRRQEGRKHTTLSLTILPQTHLSMTDCMSPLSFCPLAGTLSPTVQKEQAVEHFYSSVCSVAQSTVPSVFITQQFSFAGCWWSFRRYCYSSSHHVRMLIKAL